MKPLALLVTFILALLLLSSNPATAQGPGELCSMASITTGGSCPVSLLTLDDPITIPVVVHVIADDDGTGDMPGPSLSIKLTC